MPVKLPLINKEEVSRTSHRIADSIGLMGLMVVVVICAVAAFPFYVTLALGIPLILVLGYLLDKAIGKQPEEDKETIELSAEKIVIVKDGEESIVNVSDISSIYLWSDYYQGYSFGETAHNGQLEMVLTIKDGAVISYCCVAKHELHYKSIKHELVAWYKKGIAITEAIGNGKRIGFLMIIQNNWSFAELQAAKAELGIS